MIRLSKRYAAAASVLLVLTFIALTVSSREQRHYEDCRDPSVFRDPGFLNTVEAMEPLLERLNESTPTWYLGEVPLSIGSKVPNLQVMLIRSFEPISLYLQPENVAAMGESADAARLDWVEAGSDLLPIHFVSSRGGGHATRRSHFALYMFIYANEPVRHPLPVQLKTALPDLPYGSRPVTLVIVRGTVPGVALDRAEEVAQQWLVDTWKRYRAACQPAS